MRKLNKNEKVAVYVAIAIIAVFFGGASLMGVMFNSGESNTNAVIDIAANNPGNNMENSKFIIEDVVVGSGAEAVAGKKVTAHYVGTLTNGTQFDSSVDRGAPFSFVLGAGQVIQGWDKGIVGMKVGGKRTLTIPPELAYGENGIGPIPPNSTLIFDVELLAVEDIQ